MEDMNEKIEALMKEWAEYCHAKWPEAVFVKDGAFPFYKEQTKKILFIAREAYGDPITDQNIIDYWSDVRENLNRLYPLHSRLLFLAYGIIHGECTEEDWLNMDSAHKLNLVLAEDANEKPGAFSYAFMNASKIWNPDGPQLCKEFYSFIDDEVNRKFFIREVELLAPDIIVSGNLNEFYFFDNEEFKDVATHCADGKYDDVNCYVFEYKLHDSKKTIPCLDACHFSRSGDDFQYFHKPICRIANALIGKKFC